MQTTRHGLPSLSDLKIFKQWPDQNEVNMPSEVSYSSTPGDDESHVYQQSGYSVHPESKILRWTKLELVKDRSPLEELHILRELMYGLPDINKLHDGRSDITHMPHHPAKTNKDIITFYLSRVAENGSRIYRRKGFIFWTEYLLMLSSLILL